MLVKSIEDAALGMASVYRAIGLELPTTACRSRARARWRKFQALLAQYMPFELVIDEETAGGEEARVSKTSVAGSWGAIAGELRYFADKIGHSARVDRRHATCRWRSSGGTPRRASRSSCST